MVAIFLPTILLEDLLRKLTHDLESKALSYLRAGEAAQWIRMLAAEPGVLSLIPRTFRIKCMFNTSMQAEIKELLKCWLYDCTHWLVSQAV